jgi:hypothetical protein
MLLYKNGKFTMGKLKSSLSWTHDKVSLTGATCGVGTAYPSGALEFTTSFFVEFMLLDL